jgi:hypothetical protein
LDATSAEVVQDLHPRDHGGASAGESKVRLSLRLAGNAASAGASAAARPVAAVVANARREIHSRNAQWRGALTSTCSRDGNACAMVQRWATTARRGTANRVTFGTNGGLRKLIECGLFDG